MLWPYLNVLNILVATEHTECTILHVLVVAKHTECIERN